MHTTPPKFRDPASGAVGKLLALAVVGALAFGGYWLVQRYRNTEERRALQLAIGGFADQLRRAVPGRATTDDVRRVASDVLRAGGVDPGSASIEILSEPIAITYKTLARGGGAHLQECRLVTVPPLFDKLRVQDKAAFHARIADCSMQKYVVGFRANVVAPGSSAPEWLEAYGLVYDFQP